MSTKNDKTKYLDKPYAEMSPNGWFVQVIADQNTRRHSLTKILRNAWIRDGWTPKQMQACAKELFQVLGEMNREWKRVNPDRDLIERETAVPDPRSDAELLEAYVKLEGIERRQFFAVHGARIWRAHEASCRARKVVPFGNN